MPDLTMYRGEAKTFAVTVTDNGIPVDITDAAIYFTIRSTVPAGTITSDSDAVCALTTTNGGVVITNGSAGQFEIQISKSDTNTLASSGFNYLYGIEYIPSGGSDPQVLAQGMITIIPNIVRGA